MLGFARWMVGFVCVYLPGGLVHLTLYIPLDALFSRPIFRRLFPPFWIESVENRKTE
jgi:hypothetical protein